MTSVLLDTHIWIWYLCGSKHLKPHIKRLLSSDSARVALSPFSIWEAQMLGHKNRVELLPNPEAWIEQALQSFTVEDAPYSREIALKLSKLEFGHNDPIDRFLAATALASGYSLVTADGNLLKLQWLNTIDAR